MKVSSFDPDRWGTIASTLCAVHCAITGIAVSVLSVVGFTYLQSPYLEWGFLLLALTFGGWAARRGYQRHHAFGPLIIFGLGIILLVGSHLVHTPRGSVSAGYAELFSVLGGICLIAFHAVNRQAMNRAC